MRGRGNSDAKVANRTGRVQEIAHAAVSRLPPISLTRIVARTEGYTHAAKVWDLSIVQGPFSVAPCQTLIVRFVNFDRCREVGSTATTNQTGALMTLRSIHAHSS
jgi:hypothetical protein